MFLEVFPEIGVPRTHDDWTVTWEAIGAIGTILAALIPLGFWFVEHKKRKQAEFGMIQLREENEREEARKIAFWVEKELVSDPSGGANQHSEPTVHTRVNLFLFNSSDAPITNILFGFFESSGLAYFDSPDIPWQVLRPQDERSHSRFFPFEPEFPTIYFVEFLDQKGRKVRRSSNGKVEFIRKYEDLH